MTDFRSAAQRVLDISTELLRLYDYRFELAKMEKAMYDMPQDTTDEFNTFARERDKVERLLAKYGHQKKAAWNDLRPALADLRLALQQPMQSRFACELGHVDEILAAHRQIIATHCDERGLVAAIQEGLRCRHRPELHWPNGEPLTQGNVDGLLARIARDSAARSGSALAQPQEPFNDEGWRGAMFDAARAREARVSLDVTECGHCKPIKYEGFIDPCPCVCHRPESAPQPEQRPIPDMRCARCTHVYDVHGWEDSPETLVMGCTAEGCMCSDFVDPNLPDSSQRPMTMMMERRISDACRADASRLGDRLRHILEYIGEPDSETEVQIVRMAMGDDEENGEQQDKALTECAMDVARNLLRDLDAEEGK